jgi:hypothetical protein
MKKFIALFVLAASFTSCQKEFSIDNPANNGGGGNNPGNGGNSQSDCKACGYLPMCDGSIYKYENEDFFGTTTISIDTFSINADTSFSGVPFKRLVTKPALDTTYFNCNNAVTTLKDLNTVTAGGSNLGIVTLIPLKANEPVGATWQNTVVNGAGQNVIYNLRIHAKGLSKTVLGTTYNDVIHVKQAVQVSAGGQTITSNNDDYFYAKNIGLIEFYTITTTPIPGFSDTLSQKKLISAFIP